MLKHGHSRSFTSVVPSTLKSIRFELKSIAEFHKLADFTSLTPCCLKASHSSLFDSVDLSCLQGLHSLTRLGLQEGFSLHISAASHLTHLVLISADVDDSVCCNFASSLVKLHFTSWSQASYTHCIEGGRWHAVLFNHDTFSIGAALMQQTT